MIDMKMAEQNNVHLGHLRSALPKRRALPLHRHGSRHVRCRDPASIGWLVKLGPILRLLGHLDPSTCTDTPVSHQDSSPHWQNSHIKQDRKRAKSCTTPQFYPQSSRGHYSFFHSHIANPSQPNKQ